MAQNIAAETLNPSQQLHLLSSAQYADKLLSEVEAILTAAQSKSPFKKYKDRLSPAQAKVIDDYLARIRAQMVQVLEAQDIHLPEPAFESVHSIRVTLGFVRIAFQECTAGRMRGYGEVPESKVQEVNGLVDEMVSAVDKLDSYLARGLGQDLEARLLRLEKAGAETGTLKVLERVIHTHGLVEFRPALSMLLDRLETKRFEIALFGRVSSGKSSLLNQLVDSDILPVGVNPITAVPTRLVFGTAPRLTVAYADRGPECVAVDKLPEFVSEEYNPGNYKHVTRIVVELPSARLRDGIVFVDTPGLGSLASAGAAETMAYLPRCDTGVVLIDAGSTLTEDDLSTIRMLYDAGIPASVLLSKSDVLRPDDRARSVKYVEGQIRTRLGLNIPAHPVSIRPSSAFLLEEWLSNVMGPLCSQHQQLLEESLRRKAGTLREGVITALRSRLQRAPEAVTGIEEVDRGLRKSEGQIAEVRERCYQVTYRIRNSAGEALDKAAIEVARAWSDGSVAVFETIRETMSSHAEEMASVVYRALFELACALSGTLGSACERLGLSGTLSEDDMTASLNEMPRLDLGTISFEARPTYLSRKVKWIGLWRSRRILRSQAGAQTAEAFSNLGSMLDAWTRRTLADLQIKFESHADTYRAHMSRIKGGGAGLSSPAARTIAEDLASLEGTMTERGNEIASLA